MPCPFVFFFPRGGGGVYSGVYSIYSIYSEVYSMSTVSTVCLQCVQNSAQKMTAKQRSTLNARSAIPWRRLLEA